MTERKSKREEEDHEGMGRRRKEGGRMEGRDIG